MSTQRGKDGTCRQGGIVTTPLVTLLASLWLVLSGAPVAALPDDRDQPIHITADKAVRDEKRGVTIYSGNVEMRQGSMELDADDLTIFHEAEDANKIIARGIVLDGFRISPPTAAIRSNPCSAIKEYPMA